MDLPCLRLAYLAPYLPSILYQTTKDSSPLSERRDEAFSRNFPECELRSEELPASTALDGLNLFRRIAGSLSPPLHSSVPCRRAERGRKPPLIGRMPSSMSNPPEVAGKYELIYSDNWRPIPVILFPGFCDCDIHFIWWRCFFLILSANQIKCSLTSEFCSAFCYWVSDSWQDKSWFLLVLHGPEILTSARDLESQNVDKRRNQTETRQQNLQRGGRSFFTIHSLYDNDRFKIRFVG